MLTTLRLIPICAAVLTLSMAALSNVVVSTQTCQLSTRNTVSLTDTCCQLQVGTDLKKKADFKEKTIKCHISNISY